MNEPAHSSACVPDARPAPEVVQDQIRKSLGLPSYQGEREQAASRGPAGA